MNPGSLRNRIVFEKDEGATRDSKGGLPEDWQFAFEVPGAYEPLGSREFPASHKRMAETTVRFRMRYHPDIAQNPGKFAATHRIRFSHEPCGDPCGASSTWLKFNISPPLVDRDRREILIEASEIV